MSTAYAPPRGPLSKFRRRFTQMHAARPADLRFSEPVLSITFDDFPISAAEAGARVLEYHGSRGTYYASSGLAGTDGPSGRHFTAADIQRLVANGHEIGCHTTHHADCARRDFYSTLEDLARNRDALIAMGAPAPVAHAYPYGETDPALKDNLPRRLTSARGVLPGLNVGPCDLAQLRAYPLFGAGALARLQGDLKRAARKRAWVIAFTHDVADQPSPWGTKPQDLDALLRTAHKLGFIVLPVSAALARRLT